MNVIFVRPLRLGLQLGKLREVYGIGDLPDLTGIFTGLFEEELTKELHDITPEFLDLIVLVQDTLSSYGVKLDFFSLEGIEPIDECESILIRVL